MIQRPMNFTLFIGVTTVEQVDIYSTEHFEYQPHEDMSLEDIYFALRERIPHLKRRECTPRVMRESGVDELLDIMNRQVVAECLEMLSDEANGAPQ